MTDHPLGLIPVDTFATKLLADASWACQRAVLEDRLTADLIQNVEDALLLCKVEGLDPDYVALFEAMIALLRKWVAES